MKKLIAVCIIIGHVLLPIRNQAAAEAALTSSPGSESFIKRFTGDPIQELDRNLKQGDYRFRGIMNVDIRLNWVPGLLWNERPMPDAEYLVTTSGQNWSEAADAYFKIYNANLLLRRSSQKIDHYGWLVKEK